jgi:hypothetical protein
MPVHDPATLTVHLASSRTLSHVVLHWGRLWPAVTAPNVHPAPSPILTLRATSYDVLGSTDGTHWTRLVTVRGQRNGTQDRWSFPATQVRWLRVQTLAGNHHLTPQLEEVSAS